MLSKFILILFFLASWLSSHVQAKIKLSTAQRINVALEYLDKDAEYFNHLKCSPMDEFCWWFLFHVRIGDSGAAPMQRLSSQIPISLNGNLKGQGHIFQFPAYWLLKGVPPDALLTNGQTIDEYIKNTNWLYNFEISSDKEPSWYLIGQNFYPELYNISAEFEGPLACGGSHYLVGLYAAGEKQIFKKQLKIYLRNLEQAIEYTPEQVLADPHKADLIMHSFETLCLTGNRELIQEKLFSYNLLFLNHFQRQFDNLINSQASLQPKDLQNKNEDLAYALADMLGHFRYGLKICAEKEYNHLKPF